MGENVSCPFKKTLAIFNHLCENHSKTFKLMSQEFKYDVFLSHSSKDKDVVRELAERLKADGVRVWFDEWIIKPGDAIGIKINEGLRDSRVLVLSISANASESDWV